jgi:hypothetical protein
LKKISEKMAHNRVVYAWHLLAQQFQEPTGGSGSVLAGSLRCAQTFGLNIPTPKLRKQPERYMIF